jgi:hypothetical protein
MKPHVSIRPARQTDCPRLVEIARRWPARFVEAGIRALEDDLKHHPTVVLEYAGAPAAFLTWREDASEVELLWQAKLPEFKLVSTSRELIRYVLARVPRGKRVFLRMATADSVIPGTPFQASCYRAVNRLLRRLGFRNERVDVGYWGPQNHSLVMVYAP